MVRTLRKHHFEYVRLRRHWRDKFRERWDKIIDEDYMRAIIHAYDLEGRHPNRDSITLEKAKVSGQKCGICKKTINAWWYAWCECTGEGHYYGDYGCQKRSCSYVHGECAESQSLKNVPEMEEFKHREVYNFVEEMRLHLGSLARVQVNDLSEDEECTLCHRKFYDREILEVLQPCGIECKKENHGYADYKCYKFWVERSLLMYALDRCFSEGPTDLTQDFLKYKIIETEDEKIESDIDTHAQKIYSRF
ncbi:hypothetical protein EJF18_50738 [Clavispora lusitaniae]|uniref:Uncharacterized protein n=1 Tax=Clavispora lusitaniae TaxID=36911 RepID=A0ACD0WPP8_CLALS|nr:hypothetical protein EJF14_50738 [Clavispora lusitaniae]QFZ35157.1 hypothetical protein EJF16_50738 [Clavispora lusitaniae]QFZ46522.1 hypothetical protein EJF18_50738 [Clavispora lusitaniae]QFZ52184.1 hypothetical protein EJF17_50738 [Clavispora lusitaniae]